MLDIPQVTRNTTARAFQLIEATPEALRECADRIEQATREMIPGHSVLCELTAQVQVVFKPDSYRNKLAQIGPESTVYVDQD